MFIIFKNIFGKKESVFLLKILGCYELMMFVDFVGMMGDVKIYVELKKDCLVMDNNGEVSEIMLDDLLYYIKIGKFIFLCMGVELELMVFKMVFGKGEIKLYLMFVVVGIIVDVLNVYFIEVEEILGELDENGELGEFSFFVCIVDEKLDKFFVSFSVYGDLFVLKKVK